MSIKFTMVYCLGAIGGVAMTMTPELLTAVGALLVAVITAIGAVIVNIMTARKVERVKQLQEENLAETKVVKGHVNSTASAAAAEIKGLHDKINLMALAAAEKKEIAAVLAATVPHSNPTAAGGPASSLVNIDDNTHKIEKNTAKTEAIVETLVDTKAEITDKPPK